MTRGDSKRAAIAIAFGVVIASTIVAITLVTIGVSRHAAEQEQENRQFCRLVGGYDC